MLVNILADATVPDLCSAIEAMAVRRAIGALQEKQDGSR